MCIVDHDYYVGKGGKLSLEEFTALLKDAVYTVDYITFGRIQNPPGSMVERVKDCICAVIDEMHREQQTADLLPRGIASINNDGYSVSRGAESVHGGDAAQSAYIAICRKYLTRPVNLLYTGVY